MQSIIQLREKFSWIPIEKIQVLCSGEENEKTVFELVYAWGEEALSIFLEETLSATLILRSDWDFPDNNLLRVIARHAESSNGIWNEFYTKGFFRLLLDEAIGTYPFHHLYENEKSWFLQKVLSSIVLPRGLHLISSGPEHVSHNKETLFREVEFQYDIDICEMCVPMGLLAYVDDQENRFPAMQTKEVPWRFITKWCNTLSEKLGKEPVYQFHGDQLEQNIHANGFRLLTEAEWEAAFLHELIPLSPKKSSRDEIEWVFDSFCSYHYLFDGIDPVCNDLHTRLRTQRERHNLFSRRAGFDSAQFRLCTHASRGLV